MHLLLARANLSMGPVLLAAQNLSMFLLVIFTLSLAAKNYLSTVRSYWLLCKCVKRLNRFSKFDFWLLFQVVCLLAFDGFRNVFIGCKNFSAPIGL